jgi:hypothetical protein
MPIRINLLAEQQAAEEARRRDPVKRALWVAGGLLALMLLWAGLLQLKLASAKGSLAGYEAKLQSVEENSKEARLNWSTASQLESRIANLQRYSTNRFFSADLLDALQQVALDDVRIIQLQTAHAYSTNADSTFRTNLVFPVAGSRKGWSLWKSSQPQTNIMTLISNQIAAITSKVESLKTSVELITKVEVTTNRNVATAKIEITKPVTASEHVVLMIKARDYGNPPGRRVDEFSKAIANHPYFAQRLVQAEGEGIRLRERSIQPAVDSSDPVSPTRPFIPFAIECRYRETLRANE